VPRDLDLHALYQKDKAAQKMGIVIESLEPGQATLSMQVLEWMIQGHMICHGGFIFALADTAMAYASNKDATTHVALNANIDFLKPTKLGDHLIARASEGDRTRKTGMYNVTVAIKNGPLIAEFRGRTYALSTR
jgi:acyl-CoA thioesterase